MAERLMAEGTQGSGSEAAPLMGEGPTGPGEVQSQSPVQSSGEQSLQKPWHISPEYDPKREDYSVTEEGNYKVFTDPVTGKEIARVLKIAGGSPDIPDWVENLRPTGPSAFQQARANYETLLSINPANITDPARRTEFEQLLRDSETEIREFVAEADRVGILVDVRNRALGFYKLVRATKRYERWGRDKQQVIETGKDPRGYVETFWDNSPQFKQLEGRFREVARYIWDGIISEIDKEVNHEESPSLNVVAESEFNRLKEERRIERLGEKKYTPHEYYGTTSWELTAESAEELIPAALDWTRDRIAELADTDVNTTNKALEEIRGKGVTILETCRIRLDTEEAQDVSETNPHFLRAKAMIEAVADVLGNEKVLYKGGEEIGPQYKERFASNFIGHHDAIYLENPKVAYILHKLTTHRNGTYWLGQPFNTEKPSEGEIADYRRQIEEEIVEDAATHDLFTETVFAANMDLFPELVREPGDENRSFFELRDKYKLQFSFDDPLDRLLLDPNNQIRDKIAATGNQEALARHDRRVGVFKKIKERLDRRDGFAGLTPQERNQRVRLRIFQKMREKTEVGQLARLSQGSLQKLEDARVSGNVTAYDQIMWDWAKEYNDYRIKLRLPRWYPTGWDRVRIRIDRPTKVLDRSLSGEELEAMFEPIELSEQYSYSNVDIRRHIDDARFGFQLARSYQIFTMQDTMLGGMRTRLVDINTGQYTGKLPDDVVSRLLGLIDQNGNVIHPDWKIARIFDIVQARLEDAIAKEAADIAQAKAAGNLAALREMLVNSQFLATHVLKEIGLVEGKLPVWSYNFLDDATLDVFMKALADYGVEVAPGIPISHNNKKEFYEIMERGRRALKAEYTRAAQEHMAGTYPVFARNPDGTISTTRARSLWKASDDWGTPGDMSERYRMVSKGGLAENRRIVDTQFETSTSGGVAVTELIPSMGDLGFYPLLVWLGVTDVRGLHGYIHRRDEVEFHHHKFFDVMDPVQHARAQRQAYIARRALVGGSLGEGKSTPGFLKEPFHGAFRSADWLHSQRQTAESYGMENTAKYLALMQVFRRQSKYSYADFLTKWSGEIELGTPSGRRGKEVFREGDIEKFRQLSYLDLDKLSKPQSDEFYEKMIGILDYFQNYCEATRDVESNRRGRAPRNWEEDNHLRWYAFRRAIREAMTRPDPEKGFVIRLGYAPEVANEIAIRLMEAALMDGGYLILRQYEVDRRVQDGTEILAKVLTDDEKRRGFVIPDERDWPNQRPEIKKALETIRRRGLLEFMREEGYKFTNNQGQVIKEILGKKIPPLVQEIMFQEDSRRVVSF